MRIARMMHFTVAIMVKRLVFASKIAENTQEFIKFLQKQSVYGDLVKTNFVALS
jgi:hypothetical protein